ncbi:leucine-rich repeat-containing protein 40 isoform X2 [Syngnathoides biaculeatus]|uniref:leucine-rich repeat-containing protein 40 isoform X2 n=1 Tax=Syngnathoides biaculeatus TaxID=300417 RepID=UPI002ADDF7A6|nr:leucine-rich repeat-containing protein 40 isoform X2 [Syngnathoides biaculeatus]
MSRLRGAREADSLRGFRTPESEPSVPYGLLKAARQSGTLDLTNRNLTEVPASVYRLNVDTPEEAHRDVSFGASERWWEQTDLTKLLLASNRLSRLSDDIRLLPALAVLDLHDNQLQTLPSALEELRELQRLRLGHNRLRSLPPEVFGLERLRSLTLQHNLLEALPEELGQLEALTELDVSDNRLTELPHGLGRLRRLQKLHLCRNKLARLPDNLAQLTDVKLLDCSENLLSDVPAGLSQMPALEQLYLRHNKLRRLPPLCAPALKELYAGNNQIQSVDGEHLSGTSALSVLELRDNKIETLPDELSAMNALARLDLTNNDIGTLPASLGLLPDLKILLLEGNPLRGIRRDLLTKGTAELLKYLRGRLKEEPDSAADVPTAMTLPSQAAVNVHNIKTLKLLAYSNRKAELIPDELFGAAAGHAVTSADFSKNLLSDVPPRLAEWRASLTELNVAFNRLVRCDLVCSLPNLVHLDLGNNQLTDLPGELKNLTKLHSVILNHNKFKSFPEALYRVPSLETVLLANNQVGGVDPARLLGLVRLSTLDLSNNDLLNVPPQLGLCTTLRCLSLEGNPFRTPRAAIVAKGTDAVLEYLRSRIPA